MTMRSLVWRGNACSLSRPCVLCQSRQSVRLQPLHVVSILTFHPDGTLITTLAAPISASFDSYSLFAWVFTSYMIPMTAVQPIAGKLSDIFGRKPLVVFPGIIFIAGTLMCGLAPSFPVLLAGRALSGLGGGALSNAHNFILGDIIPLRQRGLWQGIINVGWGVSMGLGGAFGGLVNAYIGWRWAFLIQIPFLVMIIIIAAFTLNLPAKPSSKSKFERIDFRGVFSIVVSVALFLLGLDLGANHTSWTHPLVLTSLPISAILLVNFVYTELYIAKEPVIPIRLLFNRHAISCCVMFGANQADQYILFYFIPMFLEVALAMTTDQIAFRLLVLSAGMATGSLSCGSIITWTGRYYWQTLIVQVLKICITTSIAILFTRTDTLTGAFLPPSDAYLFAIMFAIGWCTSGGSTNIQPGFFASTGAENQPVMSSACYTIRFVGSTLGVTVAGVVFQSQFAAGLQQRFGDLPDAHRKIRNILDDLSAVGRLSPEWHEAVIAVFAEAMGSVWLMAVVLTGIALFAGLFMREITLNTKLVRK